MEVIRLDKEEWSQLSENAHLIAFNEVKPASWDRIDFALLAKVEDRLVAYVTCRETDMYTLYWQFGGAFPGARGTSVSFSGYQAFTSWCKNRYKRIVTLIKNENVVMLKMAMKVGFRIIGIKSIQGDVLVELHLESSL